MKNAFGATFLFQIVIFFVILFTGYICMSINQAKAFNVKNEIVKAIEKNAPDLTGLGATEFRSDIVESFEDVGYRLSGNCSEDLKRLSSNPKNKVWGCSREGNCSSNTENVAFCIAKITSPMAGGKVDAYYYKIETFYQLELPIIKNIFSMRAKGETKILYKGE